MRIHLNSPMFEAGVALSAGLCFLGLHHRDFFLSTTLYLLKPLLIGSLWFLFSFCEAIGRTIHSIVLNLWAGCFMGFPDEY